MTLKQGELVGMIDQHGSKMGPYVLLDGPLIPAEHTDKYDFSSNIKNTNMWYYVVLIGEKIEYVVCGWNTLIPWETA